MHPLTTSQRWNAQGEMTTEPFLATESFAPRTECLGLSSRVTADLNANKILVNLDTIMHTFQKASCVLLKKIYTSVKGLLYQSLISGIKHNPTEVVTCTQLKKKLDDAIASQFPLPSFFTANDMQVIHENVLSMNSAIADGSCLNGIVNAEKFDRFMTSLISSFC